MTVKELILWLSEYEEELQVFLRVEENGKSIYCGVNEVAEEPTGALTILHGWETK